jgi:hypothetical protein
VLFRRAHTWILWGPGLPPERTGLSDGSTATILISGFCSRKYLPAPVIVPPVPTPDTKMSTCTSLLRFCMLVSLVFKVLSLRTSRSCGLRSYPARRGTHYETSKLLWYQIRCAQPMAPKLQRTFEHCTTWGFGLQMQSFQHCRVPSIVRGPGNVNFFQPLSPRVQKGYSTSNRHAGPHKGQAILYIALLLLQCHILYESSIKFKFNVSSSSSSTTTSATSTNDHQHRHQQQQGQQPQHRKASRGKEYCETVRSLPMSTGSNRLESPSTSQDIGKMLMWNPDAHIAA